MENVKELADEVIDYYVKMTRQRMLEAENRSVDYVLKSVRLLHEAHAMFRDMLSKNE